MSHHRDPEAGPWFQRPLTLIALIFFALTLTDAVERLAARFEAPPQLTQGEAPE